MTIKESTLLLALSFGAIFSFHTMDNYRIEQIALISDMEMIINRSTCCQKQSAEGVVTLKRWNDNDYFTLALHPTKPLITLSNLNKIELYDYSQNTSTEFTLPHTNASSNLIKCIFNPHNNTILCQKDYNQFYLIDYKSHEIVNCGDINKGDVATSGFYLKEKWFLFLSPVLAFNPKKEEVCIGST